MSWRDWFGKRTEPVQANTLIYQEPIDAVIRRMASQFSSAAGVSVNANSAETVGAVYRCVRLLSETMASLPLVLYRVDGRRRNPAVDDPLYWLLHDQPNEHHTSFQWRSLLQRDHELRGNAYSLVVWGVGRRPVELIRLHPDRVRPKQDPMTSAITYEWTRDDSRRVELKERDVMHLWAWSDDGVIGKSSIEAHRDTIGEAIAMRQHSSKFFSNGARPAGVLEIDKGTRIDEESAQAIREDFDQLYAGPDNAWRTVVLPGGISYRPISMSAKDADYVSTLNAGIREIARIFGVPPHKIGDLQQATFSNIEHQAIEFVTDSILPRAVCWEQAIRRALLDGDRSRYVKFTLAALLRGDEKSRAEALAIKRRNGIINANEWRELDDQNPREDDGGEVYIIEKNMQPNDGREGERAMTNGGGQPQP